MAGGDGDRWSRPRERTSRMEVGRGRGVRFGQLDLRRCGLLPVCEPRVGRIQSFLDW